MKPDCPTCHFKMDKTQTADNKERCRLNGLQAKPANAADCKRYLPAVNVPSCPFSEAAG